MAASDIALLGARELRDRIAARELSAVEVVEAALERLETLNPLVNAVVTLAGTALDQARDLDAALGRGDEAGPLCGLPVGIKDVTPVRGLRHTYGSTLYADHEAERDALVVQRLRDAGAIILGKTNTPEFATGANTFNDVFGATRNPWNPVLSAGGSTGGGAAALATGMIALAEGTDLGGSLRIPASFCGVVGLRPTPGLIPTAPSAFPWDTLQVTGFMARRAEDLALAIRSVAGPSPRAPIGQSLDQADPLEQAGIGLPAGARVAYCPDPAAIGVASEVRSVCADLMEKLADEGAIVEEIQMDISWARDAFLALRGHWMLAQQFERLDRREDFSDNLRANVDAGLEIGALELARAEADRGRLWDVFVRLLSHFDFFLTPTMAVPPFPVEQSHPESVAGRPMETYIDWVAPTFLLSLTGLPVASVPVGLDPAGLPVGIQVVGPRASEGRVLGVAAAVQELCPIGYPAIG